MFCPRCSSECDDNLLFCPKCGYKINTFTKKENPTEEIKSEFFDEMIVAPQKEEEVETYISKDVTENTINTGTAKKDFFDDDDDFEDEYIPPILARNREKKVAPKRESKEEKKNTKKPAPKTTPNASKRKNSPKAQKNRVLLIVLIAIFSVALAVLITFFVKKGSMSSKFNKYYNQGNEYYTQQNYREAKTQFINAASNAFTKEEKIKSYEMIYQIDAILGGYDDEEIKYLELLIDVDPNNVEYYKSLIVLYQNNNMESKVDALVNSAPDFVKDSLEGFDGTVPVASVEGGTYDKPTEIQLTTMEGLTIYYTLTDTGSGDSIEDEEYKGPILLEKEGNYTLTAYSVDASGDESKNLTVKYTIDLNEVDPPVVNLDSGAYSTNKKIKVTAQEGCIIYYTTTGITPTVDSKKYKKQITLPDGDSLYYFVAINEDGVASDVVTRAYSVKPEYEIDYDTALSMLSLTLVSNGKFENKYGEFANGDVAYFEYTSIEEIEENEYYIITCEIETADGSTKSTDIYAVSCSTGECYRAVKDGMGYSKKNIK